MQRRQLSHSSQSLATIVLLWGLAACAPTVTEQDAPATGPGQTSATNEVPAFEAGQVAHEAFVAAVIDPASIEPAGNEGRPLAVVATIGQITDLVEQLGGNRVDVKQIVPGADDPHLYVPSPGDVQAFSEADVIFYNGLFLEGQMAVIFEQMSELGVPALPVTAGLPTDSMLEREYSPGEYVTDPHVWFDPRIWSRAADNILLVLAALEPGSADYFEARRVELQSALDALEAWSTLSMASIPEGHRVMVTSHDAFGYFGRRFGLEVIGLQGFSTEAEAGLQDVESLVNIISQRKIPAVFVEASVSPEALQAVVEAVRYKGHQVEIGGELLSSDTPGVRGTAEGSYPGMLIWNVSTVATALGGRPARPLPAALEGYGGHDFAELVEAARKEAGDA